MLALIDRTSQEALIHLPPSTDAETAVLTLPVLEIIFQEFILELEVRLSPVHPARQLAMFDVIEGVHHSDHVLS